MRRILALAFVSAASCGGPGVPRPKNLLIVCVDTLRADQLGAYGQEPSFTPALDRLAAESVVFERAHSAASWTLPSVASLFTALPSSAHGCWTFETRLSESFTTLPEVFQGAGFDTQGIASHVFFDATYGLQQGFDAFDAELAHRKGDQGWREITSPEVSARAVRWLEERARSGEREPWLLFVHFFDPHLPYVDHAAGDGPGAAQEFARYRSEIGFTDGHVGALLAALDSAGLAGETVVLFFSDHGESFLEHPPIQRHSYGLYEEELRVPLFLRVPGIAPRRVPGGVRSVDLLPTLLELFGLGNAAEHEGVSLVPALLGKERAGPPNLAEIRLKDGHHANALVSGRWKLLENVSGGGFELYDLDADPRERRDLAAEQPALVAELERELRARIERASALGARVGPAGSVSHTPEDIERLRALGYAGDEGR